MDKKLIEQALETFSSHLSERPTGIILLKRNGEFVARIGEFVDYFSMTLSNETAAALTYSHALDEIEMLEGINHGTFQYSVSIGGDGVYVIVHLNDAYLLGISYNSIGVKSIDGTLDSILDHYRELLRVLYR